MHTSLLVLIAAAIVVPNLRADPLPIKPGERYHITFASDHRPLPMWAPGNPVKIVRLFDYPWIEIEYSWTPQVQIGLNGEEEEPETQTYRRYLNLDHVVVIVNAEEAEALQEEFFKGLKSLIERSAASKEVPAEKEGADQPATAPESKTEGDAKPVPESEVRPD